MAANVLFNAMMRSQCCVQNRKRERLFLNGIIWVIFLFNWLLNELGWIKHHDFLNHSLYKFARANVLWCMLLPEHPIQSLCFRSQPLGHDHIQVACHLRCKPVGDKWRNYIIGETQGLYKNWLL